MNIKISVISPMHNEESCAEEFVSRVDKVLNEFVKSTEQYEIVVVDDGSTDNTLQILKKLTSKFINLRAIELTRNSGQSIALYAGLQESNGDYVICMDSDLQNLPEEIPLFINKIEEGYTMVSGIRKKRKESFMFRLIPSLIANYLLRITTGCSVKDMGGYKCIKGDVARKLKLRPGQHRFLPALVWVMGGTIAEIDVSFPPRKKGKSHYGLSRTFDVFLDIILFWFERSCNARPIYFFGRISFLFFIISFTMFGWACFEKFVHNINMGSRPLFILSLVGVAFSFAFISIGFVLELLSDVYNTTRDIKPYMIDNIYHSKQK